MGCFLNSRVILTMAICGCALSLGCPTKPILEIGQLRIFQVSKMEWRCISTQNGQSSVKALIYPKSESFEKVFFERQEFQKKALERHSLLEKTAPSKVLREQHQEVLEHQRNDLENLVDRWENWPMVVSFPLFFADPEPVSFVIVARHEVIPVEVALVVRSSGKNTSEDHRATLRLLLRHLDDMLRKEFPNVPLNKKPIFDDKGNLVDVALLKLCKGTEFIKQR